MKFTSFALIALLSGAAAEDCITSYEYVSGTVTYSEAVANTPMGCELAPISSRDELALVAGAAATRQCWVGITTTINEGEPASLDGWLNPDGTDMPSDSFLWNSPTEPNNSVGAQTSASINFQNTGKLRDVDPSDEFVCSIYKCCSAPFSGGDPHFKRFGHVKRSTFHGECDMVLLRSEKADLAVHIRTTIRKAYSYIEEVVVKTGKSTVFEFHHNAAYLNGALLNDKDIPLLSHDETKITKVTKGYQIDLNNGLSLIVKNNKQFLAVQLAGEVSILTDAVGMFGEYGTGDLYGRDGRAIEDFEHFGFEWQVRPEQDGQLFTETRPPQMPYERCNMPMQVSRRRALRQQSNRKLHEEAYDLCSKAHPEDVELCVDDILMTGDLDVIEAW